MKISLYKAARVTRGRCPYCGEKIATTTSASDVGIVRCPTCDADLSIEPKAVHAAIEVNRSNSCGESALRWLVADMGIKPGKWLKIAVDRLGIEKNHGTYPWAFLRALDLVGLRAGLDWRWFSMPKPSDLDADERYAIFYTCRDGTWHVACARKVKGKLTLIDSAHEDTWASLSKRHGIKLVMRVYRVGLGPNSKRKRP